ncbi:FCD domain-containing protein [Prosthecobacter sp. SYSU 5D2]|uniref:FadR/GntR family transcriptional regulator n=1 Tax=Prosthecobacter sp. SYSU 5D2 TaxID=3134134 RepID=UPI0031FEFE62
MILDTIARPPSLVEKVCQSLAAIARRDRADEENWLPTERELAAQLGVSRSVVREATKRLEQQGLLEIRQGLGTRTVNHLHKPLTGALELLVPEETERLRQLIEVRLMVEPENARLAAERATAKQITTLRAVHEKLALADSFEDSVMADMEFHRTLAVLSGNQIAGLLMQSLSELLQVSLKHGYKRVTPATAIKQHAAVVKAIEQRDSAAAARAMHRHLVTACNDLELN